LRPDQPLPDQPRALELRVKAMAWEADGVLSVTLAAAGGGELPPWTPGAHIDVDLGPGLSRQYSLCGDPADRQHWQIAVLHEPAGRGGSEFVHTRLRPGDMVSANGPRNRFALEAAGEYLFIAGGIGITPLLPMLAAASATGAAWRLLYGGRRRGSMAFLDVIAAYGGRADVLPQDETGLLPVEAAVTATGPEALVYCCGPAPLLAAVEACCAGHGRALRLERFTAKPAEPRDTPDSAFEVVCKRSGVTVPVRAGQSVLSALQDAGLPVSYSCQEGICGTCETAVLNGDIDHRDSVLSDDERAAGDTMFVCVSRSRSPRLVLDL
jgi:ferredoxin-NADP reductase